jgi:hypothetical protein
VVVLHENGRYARAGLEVALVKAFEKEAPLIAENLWLKQADFWQTGWCDGVGHRLFDQI